MRSPNRHWLFALLVVATAGALVLNAPGRSQHYASALVADGANFLNDGSRQNNAPTAEAATPPNNGSFGADTSADGGGRSSNSTLTYSIATRGHIDTDLAQFRQSVQKTLADPRGWSLNNQITFREVAAGGDFTIWVSESKMMSSFSMGCGAEWNCREGRNVIVNDKRWLLGSPTLDLSIDRYRSLIINHELGHWLGLQHTSCATSGGKASVMQQQSMAGGLGQCTANEWPLERERTTVARLRGVTGYSTGSP